MIISEYHRPSTMDEALGLLARSDVNTVPLGGGTIINGLPTTVPDAVVDLQGLGLDAIQTSGDEVVLGAMATLDEVMRSEEVPNAIRELARREAPNTLRNMATVGGTVARRDGQSGLLAAFLAHKARVAVAATSGEKTFALGDLLADPESLDGHIVTSVAVPSSGHAAFEATSRTPADQPIVLVVGHANSGGMTLAATGMGEVPKIIGTGKSEGATLADFRGSVEYRDQLVEVLSRRVVERLENS